MFKPFQPPGLKSLAEIDEADDTYGSEVVSIQGLVSEGAQGGWPGDDRYEVRTYSFAAWQRDGEALTEEELLVMYSTEPDADWDSLPEYSVQDVKVFLSEDQTRAVLVEQTSVQQPSEALLAIAEKLKTPLIFKSERFGDLVLDRRLDWFEANVQWNGEDVELALVAEDEKPTNACLESAESLWSDQQKWNERIVAYALEELLELKNDAWIEEGEKEVSAEEFKTKMELNSVSIHPDGGFEFWFDDGGLFWGHSIMVRGNVKDGPDDAGIHG